jgi:hypothetical protein
MKEMDRKKRPYQAPRVETYGDFDELTRASTKGGTGQDGGAKPSTRAAGTPT